jgi:7-cyano-7-deazaguanine synthase
MEREMSDRQVEALVGPPKAVVLLSGGLDSATALAVAKKDGFECHALSFNYGQRHKAELLAAARIAEANGCKHSIMSLDLRAIGGSALTSDVEVPKSREIADMSGAIPVTYVPGRNIIFLSIAAGLAEVLGSNDIYCGVNALDYSGYPDCRPQFIEAFEMALALGTKCGVEGKPINLRAPLINLTKVEIITLGASLGVDYGLTHSCYDPVRYVNGKAFKLSFPEADPSEITYRACGRCDSCILRHQGFKNAGVMDPTQYASI